MFGETFLPYLDIPYAYALAKRMETIRSNPVLGYRTAGSAAERQTGELLAAEMRAIGLQNVRKDEVCVDAWTFHHAVLRCRDGAGELHEMQLGAYQTQLVTDGEEPLRLVNVGKGTAADYAGKDVRGKLVLVEINQRDEWWISYPVYEAHLHGARAVLAVQSGGYGEIDDDALNAQDIGGPEDAPAFSVSRRDAALLRSLLDEHGELAVTLDADSRVQRNGHSYNILGEIPGRHRERIILFSAHYDSYFSGFQDDNTAVAMLLGIARALLRGGYQPENTLLFCCLAAEEWGVADSCFDWSTGAWEELRKHRADWPGKVIADLNFELPALGHGTRARIRSCYEYVPYLERFLRALPPLTPAYPDEAAPTAPIETWSDDFSMAVSGIPSMVNDFTGGSFMSTNYHSQFDTDKYYDEAVYRLHHQLFLLLALSLDRSCVVPLSYAPVLRRAAKALELRREPLPPALRAHCEELLQTLHEALGRAEREAQQIDALNERYAALLDEDRRAEAEALFARERDLERETLCRFRAEQDAFTRIDWYGNVFYPHELVLHKLRLLRAARCDLLAGRRGEALEKLYRVDNNAYAFTFSAEVYRHFTRTVLHRDPERMQWAAGRLLGHEDLYDTVTSLLRKQADHNSDNAPEIAALSAAIERQYALLGRVLQQMHDALERMFPPEGPANANEQETIFPHGQ